MCFTGKNIERIAKKDIVCYKKINLNFDGRNSIIISSYHKGFKYKLGKVYNASFTKSKRTYDAGIDIFRGFHSYRNKDMGNVKCIIPKGSKYYINDSERVSDSIKIVSIFPETITEIMMYLNMDIAVCNDIIRQENNKILIKQKQLKQLEKL